MIRTTTHFFLIGAALMTLRVATSAVERPELEPVVVHVPQRATEAEVERLVEEELLVQEGLRLGWHRTDPVIRGQLVRNMRFVDGETGVALPPLSPEQEGTLFERALELGMHGTDHVVRQRLVMRAHRALERGAMRSMPTDEELRDYLETQRARFEVPGRLRLSQVFLSRQRRGQELERDAEVLGSRLRGEGSEPEAAYRLGDPFPLIDARGGRPEEVTTAELVQRYGRGFGMELRDAPLGQWIGPLRSSYGLHFVWIHERRDALLPPLGEIRDEVLASFVHDRIRPRARAAHVERLRSLYGVRIMPDDSEGSGDET